MFTGLVSDVGAIVAIEDLQGTLRRMRVHCAYDAEMIALGASIACSGPCLTVVAKGPREGGAWFEVDAAPETLARTTVGQWHVGRRINLERSLRIGDELGGHLVTGHIDATTAILSREQIEIPSNPWAATARFEIQAPAGLRKFIAEKGSIALDGTSLTVNSVVENAFSVLLIPHSLAVTTWGDAREGTLVNLEVDLMARYAARKAEVDRG